MPTQTPWPYSQAHAHPESGSQQGESGGDNPAPGVHRSALSLAEAVQV